MRSFFAVELSAEQRQAAAELVASLDGSLDGIRWVAPQLMHITVRFLGDIDGDDVAGLAREVAPAVSALEPFTARFDRVGRFPPRGRARVLWIGFGDGNDRLTALAGKVDDALARWGLPQENRPFTPHVTIGRARRAPISTRLLGDAAVAQSAMTVSAVTLFESQLSPTGPRYTRLARFPLDGEVQEVPEQQ